MLTKLRSNLKIHVVPLSVAVMLLTSGAGLAVLALWLGGAAWSDGNGATSGFCSALRDWHAAQVVFLNRVNEPGSRDEEGIDETQHIYFQSGRLALPEAKSSQQEELRNVLRQTIRVEEEWLTELTILNAVTSPSVRTSVSERVEAMRKQEAKRLELNDLLREANALLQQVCDLPPLPIYSEE